MQEQSISILVRRIAAHVSGIREEADDEPRRSRDAFLSEQDNLSRRRRCLLLRKAGCETVWYYVMTVILYNCDFVYTGTGTSNYGMLKTREKPSNKLHQDSYILINLIEAHSFHNI